MAWSQSGGTARKREGVRPFPEALISGVAAIVTACAGTTVERQPAAGTFEKSRALMVDEQIAARDIKNPVDRKSVV